MNRAEFDTLFETEFLNRLKPLGFAYSGRSVFLRESLNAIALIRLGGRFSQPSAASWVLCFRHSFLRSCKDAQQLSGIGEVFDYPFKFCPEALAKTQSTAWRYAPRNLNYDYETFDYAAQSSTSVTNRLAALAEFVKSAFIPWTISMTPIRVRDEIARNGQRAWIEKIWLEDYDRFLSGEVAV